MRFLSSWPLNFPWTMQQIFPKICLVLLNDLRPPFCTLLAKLGRWGWLKERPVSWEGMKSIPRGHHLPQSIPRGHHLPQDWWALGGDEIHTQGHHLPQDLVVLSPQSRLDTNGPPSRPHLVLFYDIQGEGVTPTSVQKQSIRFPLSGYTNHPL